ncbi:MAG: PqqD family protein [Planctomycetota bacterium]
MAGDVALDNLDTIAWHGLALRVPPDWAPSKMTGDLSSGTLVVADCALPRMHLDWTRRRRPPRLERSLARLLARLRAEASRKKAHLRPEERSFALPSDKTGAFAGWTTGIGRAFAGVIVCASCGRLTTLRAAYTGEENADALFAAACESFQDHPVDDWLDWSIYRLRVRTPASASLLESSIRPGRIDLTFRDADGPVRIAQFGLARMVLSDGRLEGVFENEVARRRNAGRLDLREESFDGHDSLRWSPAPGLRRSSRDTVGRIWHCPDSNRVYLVETRSKGPGENGLGSWCRNVFCHLAGAGPAPVGLLDPLPPALAGKPRLSPFVSRVEKDDAGLARIILAPGVGRARSLTLSLDALGTAVLALCDGSRDCGTIIRSFAAEHRLHPREAYVSVASFLSTLVRRRAIDFEVEDLPRP